ncbi:MAG TPA: carbohydrate kinase family protein, partial [Candidatus Moranbacteria bacterium]|nr:carbohydrate kinase family protein [Candidatus Moranbacteria bacterium]
MKIISIGSSTKDVFFPVDGGTVLETPEDLEAQRKVAFELGAKYQLTGDRRETVGGCAANVACGLARLGVKSFCCTRVGNDQTGKWIKDEMAKMGVEADLIQTDEKCQSDLSFIIDHLPSEDRIIFSDRDSNEKLDISAEKMMKVGAEWIFVSSLNGNEEESWENKMDKILQLVKENNLKLIFNPGQKNIKNNPQKVIVAAGQSHILLVNKDEAIEIVSLMTKSSDNKLNDEKFLVEKTRETGAKIVVITDGIRGAWGFDGKQIFHVDALVRKAVDTTGAGDAFASGFLAAHLKGKNIGEALQWGIINSSNS